MREEEKKFISQLHVYGLKPKEGSSYEELYQKAIELTESEDQFNFNDPRLASLWEFLQLEKRDLNWPEYAFTSEDGLKKRCLLLADTMIEKMAGNYPKTLGELDGDMNWEHLLQHGKLGLMSLLFALEKNDDSITLLRAAPMIDEFMNRIEETFLNFLFEEKSDLIAKILNIPHQEAGQSFEDYIFGRLQPFSLMRSVYLEKPHSELRPLRWWTLHERYIPNLP